MHSLSQSSHSFPHPGRGLPLPLPLHPLAMDTRPPRGGRRPFWGQDGYQRPPTVHTACKMARYSPRWRMMVPDAPRRGINAPPRTALSARGGQSRQAPTEPRPARPSRPPKHGYMFRQAPKQLYLKTGNWIHVSKRHKMDTVSSRFSSLLW